MIVATLALSSLLVGVAHASSHHHPKGVYFDEFSTGNVLTNQIAGLTITAERRKSLFPNHWVPGHAMIFNTANPTGGDVDLGSPHERFGGPGLGNGGQHGPFANKYAQGNVLMVSEDGDPADPDDNMKGGRLTINFDSPVFLGKLGLLDNDEGVEILVYDSDNKYSNITNFYGSDNSFVNIVLAKPGVTKLVVTFFRSGALTDLEFTQPTDLFCCVHAMVDFDALTVGSKIESIGNTQVTTQMYPSVHARKNGLLENGVAMIFDTHSPNPLDLDLGTPHMLAGGKGEGKQGKPGQLYPNMESQGHALIISGDENSDAPNDNAYGGVIAFDFADPIDLDSVGLLDNDEGTIFEIYSGDKIKAVIENFNGGNNSYELVKMNAHNVSKLVVKFLGSGALTSINENNCMQAVAA